MLNRQYDTFIACDAEYAESEIVLYGAPFDSTTSFRPGTRFAGRTMRGDSFGLETYSPYQDKDLLDYKVFDSGDIELPFGDPKPALAMIEARAGAIIQDGKRPIMIGGEHLATLGAVRAAHARHPDLHIMHFDAHADLREDYLGQTLSHATVMRRSWELLGDGRIHQFGIRSGEREEFAFARHHTRMTKFGFDGLEEAIRAIGDAPVYLSIDLDVMDPSVFPGTGTPEPGGVSFAELLRAMLACGQLNIVGADVMELSPPYDKSGISTAAACKVLREMLLMLSGPSQPHECLAAASEKVEVTTERG